MIFARGMLMLAGAAMIVAIWAMILSLFMKPAHAGAYLDLGVGMHVREWQETPCECGYYLSEQNPLGLVRIGYATDPRPLGVFEVNLDFSYLHISSMAVSTDTGIDAAFAVVRIQ